MHLLEQADAWQLRGITAAAGALLCDIAAVYFWQAGCIGETLGICVATRPVLCGKPSQGRPVKSGHTRAFGGDTIRVAQMSVGAAACVVFEVVSNSVVTGE
jgi:hypothetical protein